MRDCPVVVTKVQEETYSSGVSLVQAKTGTGKTVAFLLPAIQKLLTTTKKNGQVAILILSPTRELALQIAAEAQRLVEFPSGQKREIQVHTAFGGSSRASYLKKFRKSDPAILVATPGRLKDYLEEEDVRAKFDNMQTLILDEADRMLDAGKAGRITLPSLCLYTRP